MPQLVNQTLATRCGPPLRGTVGIPEKQLAQRNGEKKLGPGTVRKKLAGSGRCGAASRGTVKRNWGTVRNETGGIWACSEGGPVSFYRSFGPPGTSFFSPFLLLGYGNLQLCKVPRPTVGIPFPSRPGGRKGTAKRNWLAVAKGTVNKNWTARKEGPAEKTGATARSDQWPPGTVNENREAGK